MKGQEFFYIQMLEVRKNRIIKCDFTAENTLQI